MHDIFIVDVAPGDEAAAVARIRDLVAETGAHDLAFMVTAVPNEEPLADRLRDWVHRFRLLQKGFPRGDARAGRAAHPSADRPTVTAVALRGRYSFQPIVGADGVVSREELLPARPRFPILRQDADDDASPRGAGVLYDRRRLPPRLARPGPSRLYVPAPPGAFCGDDGTRPVARGAGGPLRSRGYGAAGAMGGIEAPEPRPTRGRDPRRGRCRRSLDPRFAGLRRSGGALRPGHRRDARGRSPAAGEGPQRGLPGAWAQGLPRTCRRHAARDRVVSPATTVLTEADTCPHNRHSLSVRSHLAHLTATTLVGCRGGKYWFIKTDEDGWRETMPFVDALKRARPFLDEVGRIRDHVTWLGPQILGRIEEIVRKPWDQQRSLDFPTDDWGWRVFGRLGIPFTVETGGGLADADPPDAPRALCSTAAVAFDDDELRALLAGPLLLDGEAVGFWVNAGSAIFSA